MNGSSGENNPHTKKATKLNQSRPGKIDNQLGSARRHYEAKGHAYGRGESFSIGEVLNSQGPPDADLVVPAKLPSDFKSWRDVAVGMSNIAQQERFSRGNDAADAERKRDSEAQEYVERIHTLEADNDTLRSTIHQLTRRA